MQVACKLSYVYIFVCVYVMVFWLWVLNAAAACSKTEKYAVQWEKDEEQQ